MSALLHPDGLRRCPWPKQDPLYVAYHDDEWGVPEYDDRALFEKLILDGFQAGLSWITILRKRDNFRKAFDNFEPKKIAKYDARKIAALMNDAGIVRNRQKIEGAAKIVAFAQDRNPRQPGLETVEDQFFEQSAGVEFRHAPFVVVIGDVERIVARPGTAHQTVRVQARFLHRPLPIVSNAALLWRELDVVLVDQPKREAAGRQRLRRLQRLADLVDPQRCEPAAIGR